MSYYCSTLLILLLLLVSYSDSAAAASVCPIGWKVGPHMKNCFIHIPESHSWQQSDSLCQHHCAASRLASLTSSQQLIFARTHLCPTNHSCWISNNNSNSSSDAECPLLTHTTLHPAPCNSSHHLLCMLPVASNCHRRKHYFIILSLISLFILCTTLLVVIWLLAHKRTKRRTTRRSHKLSNPPFNIFTNEQLRSITKNFSQGNRLLGDAKTGATYSGLLPDGSKVAVKRLKPSNFQRKKDFYSQIARVTRLHHPNLVALKGCCYHNGDRYIVYEFVANGPLDRWLHHIPRGGRCLNWSMRIRIATTLAQGIAFLHDKVKPHVVHRDIRASNVLLDEEFGAHLMGVGVSKFVPWEVMHERTVMAATYGYLAPEFVYRNELTTKSDVYSFGVLLLEIISGCRPSQSVVDSVGWQSIFEWATPLVQAHRHLDLLDPHISDIPEIGTIHKVVDLVYACTQHVPSVRPRMSHVVHQLQLLGLKAAAASASDSAELFQLNNT